MTETRPGLHVVENETAYGEVSDVGAQPLRWRPAGGADVLFLSPLAEVGPGLSPHSGSPICWPWFGPGRGAAMSPLHGFVRKATWRHVGTVAVAGGTRVTHALTSDDVTDPQWPHAYAAEHAVTFGAAYEQSLTITNTGTEPFDFEEALHAYLAVGDVRQVRIDGLDDVGYFDKTTMTHRVRRGALTFDGEVDAVHRSCGPVVVVDPVLGRKLRVEIEEGRNLVVWNPGPGKAAELADIGSEHWPGFVCVEGANVFERAVALEPGERHTLTYRLRVEPLG